MFKGRKGRVQKFEIDWVARGLDPPKVKDGPWESDDTAPQGLLSFLPAEVSDERKEEPEQAKISAAAQDEEVLPVSLAEYVSGDRGDTRSGQAEELKEQVFKVKGRRGYRRRKRGGQSSRSSPGLDFQQKAHGVEQSSLVSFRADDDEASLVDNKQGGAEAGYDLSESRESNKVEKHDHGAFGSGESHVPSSSASVSGDKLVLDEEGLVEKLQKLAVSIDSMKLLQSELEGNKQEQLDEVVVLQAIYEKDFVILKQEEGQPLSFAITIHLETPKSLDVMVKLPSDSNQSKKENSNSRVDLEYICNTASSSGVSSSKLHACTLQYLPPIRFICTLPMSYPSQSPPMFTLWSRWLNLAMLSSLCKGLDNLWEKQAGQVVIYAWTEWLHSYALSYLGVTNELELASSKEVVDMKDNQDCRAISGCSSADVDIPWLILYNEEQKNEEFCKAIHMCNICFIEQPGSNFIRLPCRHIFCYTCMEQHSFVHVKEGTVNQLNCPDATCRTSLPPMILKQLLGEDSFQRWESLLLQKTLDSMSDVVYCPRCEMVCIEDKDHLAQCIRCFFNFCSLCRGGWHAGQECMSVEAKLRILQERQKGRQAGEEQRRKEEELVNELLNLKYVQREAKQCPACKMAISKIEGCNKMTCGNCGKYFCYLCNKMIDGYDHFREGCILFEQEEIERWDHVMNDRQREMQARVELWPDRGRPCPNCGQLNIKEGNNNHIFCWSCQNHFCALCRKMVRRSSEHYGSGPNKCRQHTLD